MFKRLLCTISEKISETLLQQKLARGFPKASAIQVKDISGGCGAMFEIYVESPEFNGLPIVKQHQMVNQVLIKEVKEMHGIRISTSPTSS